MICPASDLQVASEETFLSKLRPIIGLVFAWVLANGNKLIRNITFLAGTAYRLSFSDGSPAVSRLSKTGCERTPWCLRISQFQLRGNFLKLD